MAARHRRIAEIGRGGMARVVLALMRGAAGSRKLVVLKELLPDLASDPEFRQMFMDEARLAARLNHAHVVQTFEVLEEDGECAIVMEYLEGQPLSRVRARLKQSAPDALLPIQLRAIIEVLAGLAYAHALTDFDGTPLRIVHRDVSPHNVFVTYAGSAKVLDFGIAKASDSSSQTRTGTMKGKLAYMSPEQARGELVDARADVFSVGVMLWEAVVGRRIWSGLNDAAILHRLLTAQLPSPLEIAPHVPPAFDVVCRTAMAVDREHRYPSAAAMREALEEAIASAGIQLPTAATVGATLEAAFVEERAKVRGIIDEQTRLHEGVTTAEYRALSPELVSLPSPSGTGSRSGVQSPTTGPTGASLALGRSMPPAVAPARPWITFAVAAVGAVVVGVGIFFGARRLAQPSAVELASATGSVAPPARTVAGPKMVRLTLVGLPPGAVVSVDGRPLPPGETSVDGVAGELHALRVVAPGYAATEITVTLASDQTLPITMGTAASTTRPSLPSSTARVPPPPTAKPTATVTAKPSGTGVDLGY
jgi:serine/threonine-protein kinase